MQLLTILPALALATESILPALALATESEDAGTSDALPIRDDSPLFYDMPGSLGFYDVFAPMLDMMNSMMARLPRNSVSSGSYDSLQPFPADWASLWNAFPMFGDVSPQELRVPNVTFSGDNCLVTIDMSQMADLNNTSVNVYSSGRSISVEISHIQTYGGTNSITTEVPHNNDQTDDTLISTLENSEREETAPSKPRLRGSAFEALSTVTTVHSFAAPAGCNVTSIESKAALSDHKLLVKFPKLDIPEEENLPDQIYTADPSAPIAEFASLNGVSDFGKPSQAARSGWWNPLRRESPFSETKVHVPLVAYDEF